MAMIKGITVRLITRHEVGRDGFNSPIYEEQSEEIENVLVGEPSSEDVVNTLNLTGKRAQYTLAIPKGDTHSWEGAQVEFFGRVWRVIGIPVQGIEENIPLDWNRKVQVERYEQAEGSAE
jgi:hypothetical protein